ncbi:MAG: hypothetical protein RIS43_380 [Actinomycetota bacterium]
MSDQHQNQNSQDSVEAARDLAQISSVEIVGLHAVDLMTAAAVKLGLFEGGEAERDLAEARILIDSLAGLIDAAARNIGHHHAAPLRDGLKSLQMAFREYSPIQDEPGAGPGEKYTGYVAPHHK